MDAAPALSHGRAAAAVGVCVVAGCATPARVVVVAQAEPSQAAMELECMGECLDEPDSSCDDCAARCFAPPTGVLLSLSR